MATINSIAKQMCINSFDLSYDLLNEIKSYCFYDKKTWELMNFIKYKKQRICHLFKNATVSRANPYDIYINNENTDQQWVFWTFDEDDGPNKQFQAFNCKHCGNYNVFVNDIIFHTDKIICLCPTILHDIPELIEITDEEDEFDDDSIGV